MGDKLDWPNDWFPLFALIPPACGTGPLEIAWALSTVSYVVVRSMANPSLLEDRAICGAPTVGLGIAVNG